MQCMRLAEAPGVFSPADGAATEAAAEEVEEAVAEMSAGRVAAVEELFKAWDPEGVGSISVDKLQKGTTSVGPAQVP